MCKKVIKIDLSTFFDDERKMACVLVDSKWKSVACLQKRVELLFNVDSIRLLGDGCFLPPQESIEIIKFCNNIKAFVSKESLEIRKKKKSKKCKHIEKSPDNSGCEQKQQTDILQKKRKSNSLQSSNSSNNLSHKHKRLKNSNMNHSVDIASDGNEVAGKISKTKTDCISKDTTDYGEFEEQSHSCVAKSQIINKYFEEKAVSCGGPDDQYIQRHTSTPNEKKMADITENSLQKTLVCDIVARPSSIPSSTFLNESKMIHKRTTTHLSSNPSNPNNPFQEKNFNSSHIHFNETGDEVVNSTTQKKVNTIPTQEEEPKTSIIFRCPLNDVTNDMEPRKPRIFHLTSKNTTTSSTNKPVVEIQEDIILPPHPIQKILNGLSLTNKETTSEINNLQEMNESTMEANDLTEKTSFNNTKNHTGSAAIAYIEEQMCSDNLEASHKVNITELHNESHMQPNIDGDVTETPNKSELKMTEIENESQTELTNVDVQKTVDNTTTSVDCVDLSIDADEENKLEGSVHKTQNLTEADAGNMSSASDVEEISEIIVLNESEDNFNTTINKSLQNNNNNNIPSKDIIKIKEILPFSTDLTDLTDLPKAENIIIFKVPHKNKNILSTNYMAGKVEYINRRTKSIKILIIDGLSELCHVPNKFLFCNMDDSLDYTKYLQLKLTDMHEAKLFSKS